MGSFAKEKCYSTFYPKKCIGELRLSRSNIINKLRLKLTIKYVIIKK